MIKLYDKVWWCGICETNHFIGDPCPKTRMPREKTTGVKMSVEEKYKHAGMLKYFHEEKGDMRRYIHFDDVIDEFPTLKRALGQYEYAQEVLDLVIKEL